jgi:16S rRNA (uracil1498-N3)-methyltransferase
MSTSRKSLPLDLGRGILTGMAERFYINSDLSMGPVALDGPEAHHLANVSRIRPGGLVRLFNGDGNEYQASVIEVTRKSVRLAVSAVTASHRELPHALAIACPLPKGDRAQFLIEKLTELGVTAFIPLLTQRTVTDPSPNRLEKLNRYVIEASKQCGRNVLMRIEHPSHWKTFVNRTDLPNDRRIADPSGSAISSAAPGPRAFAIGPEGGLTGDEREMGKKSGWSLVSLGPRILRVETAAIAMAVVASTGV